MVLIRVKLILHKTSEVKGCELHLLNNLKCLDAFGVIWYFGIIVRFQEQSTKTSIWKFGIRITNGNYLLLVNLKALRYSKSLALVSGLKRARTWCTFWVVSLPSNIK